MAKMMPCVAAAAVVAALIVPPAYAQGSPSGRAKVAAGAPAKPPGYQARKFRGGQGASWKTGRNSYGFQGAYGGCQYVGGAGPGGFKIDRVCR